MNARVTENLLQGNYGEHLVAQILSRSCLVRPVVGNTDVGVDLYCESVIDGRPFLHFWAQVKSSRQFPNEPGEPTHAFRTASLGYWSRQPVPVLAFLVPICSPLDAIGCIHVVDLSLDLLNTRVNTAQKTQTLQAKRELALPLSEPDNLAKKLRDLLLDHIPMVVSAQYAAKGLIYPAPKPTEEYTQYFSGHFLHRYISKIEKCTKNAVAFGVRHFLDAGFSLTDVPKVLLAGLWGMKEDPHYETHETIGVVQQAGGDVEGAKSSYERAINFIVDDPSLDHTAPPWSENVERLRNRIEGCGHA